MARLALDEAPGDFQIARHVPSVRLAIGRRTSSGAIGNPADPDRTHQAVPLHRHRSLLCAVAEDEYGS